MTRRILVPLDGSDLAEQVLTVVEDLAHRLEAELLLIQVLPTWSAALIAASAGSLASGELVYQEMDAEIKSAQAYLSRLASTWRNRGVAVSFQVLLGDATEETIKSARANKVWMIAMTDPTRSGLGRLIAGSVADKLLQGEGAPVLLFTSGAAERGKRCCDARMRIIEEQPAV